MTTAIVEAPPADPVFDDDDEGKPIRWVTVASFTTPEDAHLARLRLDEHEIPCYIADEYITGTAWHYALAIRGAKVQVPIEWANDAGEMLAANSMPARAELLGQVGVCPRCASTDLRAGRTGRRLLGMFMLVGIFLMYHPLAPVIALAAGVFYIAMTVTSVCQECGYEWHASPQRGFDVLPPNQDVPRN